MLTLSTVKRRELTALAHKLNPVVTIGKMGLTKNVLNEVDVSLSNHELIKIKVMLDDRNARDLILTEICQKVDGTPIKHIGKIFVIYRPAPEEAEKTNKPTKATKNKPRKTKRSFQS